MIDFSDNNKIYERMDPAWNINLFRKDGLDIRCKSCASFGSKIQHYKKLYGFTKEQAENHLKNQHGSCKICGKDAKLYVDHNHQTGKVRGLICNNCNTVIGSSI